MATRLLFERRVQIVSAYVWSKRASKRARKRFDCPCSPPLLHRPPSSLADRPAINGTRGQRIAEDSRLFSALTALKGAGLIRRERRGDYRLAPEVMVENIDCQMNRVR